MVGAAVGGVGDLGASDLLDVVGAGSSAASCDTANGEIALATALAAGTLDDNTVHSGALPGEADATGGIVALVKVESNCVRAVRELHLLVLVRKTRGEGAGVAVVAAAVQNSVNINGLVRGEAVFAATLLVVVGADVEAALHTGGDVLEVVGATVGGVGDPGAGDPLDVVGGGSSAASGDAAERDGVVTLIRGRRGEQDDADELEHLQ